MSKKVLSMNGLITTGMVGLGDQRKRNQSHGNDQGGPDSWRRRLLLQYGNWCVLHSFEKRIQKITIAPLES
jgi:hypothetical protein